MQAGAHVKDEVCRALVVLLSNAPELHGYVARSVYRALHDAGDDAAPSLITFSAWFLGASLMFDHLVFLMLPYCENKHDCQ